MAKYTVKEITDKEVWEKFLLARNPHSFLQSWSWGEVHKALGYKIIRLGFFNALKLVGICLMIHQPAKRGPHFIIPSGPVINWQDEEITEFALQTIKKIAEDNKVWFIRLRPELEDSDANRELINDLGFVNSPMHLHGENTLVVDIRPPSEEILKNMRKNTRYAIKKGLAEGYSFELTTDPADTKVLAYLQKDTVKRHKFVGFNPILFQEQIKQFGGDNSGGLIICKKNNQNLVAAIVVFYGEYAYYHHSGSTDAARKTNASYATQWQIILEAKKRGLKYYDLWGIAPTDDPNHRFAGVTVFKKGFGGTAHNWVHARDIPTSKLYWLTFVFENIRKKLRHL